MSGHDSSRLITRYGPVERFNHWLTAITFLLLTFSGLALFHPSMFWFSQFFGGGTWTRILHPYIGLVMFLSFSGLALRYWRHNLLSRNDIVWLTCFWIRLWSMPIRPPAMRCGLDCRC